jgi:Tfp pilus assembly protein PilF
MDFYLPASAPEGTLGDIYQALAVELVGGNASSFARLERLVPTSGIQDTMPFLQLARTQMRFGKVAQAEQTLRSVLKREPSNVRALTWLALTLSSVDLTASIEYLEQAQKLSKFEDPDLFYNLGVLYARNGHEDQARQALQRTVELRPLHTSAWMQLGLLHERQQHFDLAAEALRRSLAIEPKTGRARLALAKVLAEDGRRDEALRVLRLGLRWSDDPDGMQRALTQLGASPDPMADGIKSDDGPTEP